MRITPRDDNRVVNIQKKRCRIEVGGFAGALTLIEEVVKQGVFRLFYNIQKYV